MYLISITIIVFFQVCLILFQKQIFWRSGIKRKILKKYKPQNFKSLFLTLGCNEWKWSSALCLEIFSVSNEKSNLIGSVRAKQICSQSLMDRALPLFFNQFVCPIESSSHVFCNQTEKKLVCSSLLLYYSNFLQEKWYLQCVTLIPEQMLSYGVKLGVFETP